MNRIVLSGIAAFALLVGAGLALTESSAQAGHGCGGGLFGNHGGLFAKRCGGGGLFSGRHSSNCGGGGFLQKSCGGGLLARLRAKHNSCCAPEPVCCEPAPQPVCCEPAPTPCCEPAPTACCGSSYGASSYAAPAASGCSACAGGEVIYDSGAMQGGQPIQEGQPAPPAPSQDGGNGGGQQDAPQAPPAPAPEAAADANTEA